MRWILMLALAALSGFAGLWLWGDTGSVIGVTVCAAILSLKPIN